MKKAIISVTLFNFLGAGITFLINILLARIFPYEIFGRINLLLSLNAILIILFQFGFFNSMVIFYNKNKIEELDRNLLNTITKKFFKYILFVSPVFISIIYFLNYYYKLTTLEIMFLSSLTICSAVYSFFAIYYQTLGKWSKYNFLNVFYNILKGIIVVLGALLLTLIFKIKLSYNLFLELFIIYAIILLIFGVTYSRSLIGFKSIRKYNDKDFNSLVLSIGFSNIIIALSMRLDNVIIEKNLGEKQVAIYSAANTLALVFPLITGSILGVLMKEVSKNSLFYLKKIIQFQKKYLFYLIGAIVVVVLASPFLIKIFFGEKYEASIHVFQVLTTVYIGGIFFTPLESYFYNENARFVFTVKFSQLIIFVISAILLIHFFALIGVAVAVLITRVCAWILFYVLSRKKINDSNILEQLNR